MPQEWRRLPVTEVSEEQTGPVEGEDFYWEGPYIVFTEAWHRKRGYCCGSGCRHCPWKQAAAVVAKPEPEQR
jgi:hypothetical protein